MRQPNVIETAPRMRLSDFAAGCAIYLLMLIVMRVMGDPRDLQ